MLAQLLALANHAGADNDPDPKNRAASGARAKILRCPAAAVIIAAATGSAAADTIIAGRIAAAASAAAAANVEARERTAAETTSMAAAANSIASVTNRSRRCRLKRSSARA